MLNPLKNKDFADKRVRQAFLYAIDRKSILQNVYHIPEPVLLNCLFLNPALNPPDVHTYDFDPAKAKALLTEAGVDPASWGELDFDTYYGDQGSLDAMTAIQANLADVGIKVKIQQMDSASWSKKFYDDGNSTMSMIGGDGGGAAGGYGNGTLNSASAWPKGGNGWKGYHYENAELDAALDAVGTEFDEAKRTPPSSRSARSTLKSSRSSTCGRRPGTGSSTTGSPTSSAHPARAWATTTRLLKPGTSSNLSRVASHSMLT